VSLASSLTYEPTRSPAVLRQTIRRFAQKAAPDQACNQETRLREIIELGKKALQRKECAELALDLLGLDGVSFPIVPRREESQN
jgi:hypothetical protein